MGHPWVGEKELVPMCQSPSEALEGIWHFLLQLYCRKIAVHKPAHIESVQFEEF